MTPAHLTFFQMHPFFLVGAWWVASAAIGALAAPTAKSSEFYAWFFKFANTLAANVSRAWATKLENSPNFPIAGPNLIEGDTKQP